LESRLWQSLQLHDESSDPFETINQPAPPEPVIAKPTPSKEFLPLEPASLAAAGLTVNTVEALVLKHILASSVLTGRQIADGLRLPLAILGDLLRRLKTEQIVVYKSSSGVNDYEYELTPQGFDRAHRLFQHSSYHGPAPVPLADYVASVAEQSPSKLAPKAADLRRALAGLQIDSRLFSQLGEAISSIGAMFLYGAPGNGKTSIAERLTAAFGPTIWIPHVIDVDGEFIQLFDPIVHTEVPVDIQTQSQRPDNRWAYIRRPTIIAGGELTLENLEMGKRSAAGLVEAPLHLKSNCGTLVIDDFGRQRVSTVDLLNRWIVPLEKRYDYLTTPCGRKIQVPFNQMIVFATNLEPRQLVDEAFLRRIPYKIETLDPTEDEFRRLCRAVAESYAIVYHEEVIDHLIDTHYRKSRRPFRFCHPRDLMLQVRNHCNFHERNLELTIEAIDAAVANYFVGAS
jgi:hypothetical protein